jgi:hypothetical protein
MLPTKHHKVFSILKKIVGAFLVLFGLFALVTPLTPGAWLAIIGLEMLGWGFIWRDHVRPLGERMLGKKTPQTKKNGDNKNAATRT